MTIILTFWLGLFIALSNGTAAISEISSITSDNLTPDVTTLYEWPCLPDFDETCYMFIENGVVVETGP